MDVSDVNQKTIQIALRTNGDLSNTIIGLNYAQYLSTAFCDELEVHVFVTNDPILLDILSANQYNLRFHDRNISDSDFFQCIVELELFPNVIYYDRDKIIRVSRRFTTLLDLWIQFKNDEQTKIFLESGQKYLPNIFLYLLANKQKIYNSLDINSFLGVKGTFLYKINERNIQLYQPVNIPNNKKIITITYSSSNSTLYLPISFYESLCDEILKMDDVIILQLVYKDDTLLQNVSAHYKVYNDVELIYLLNESVLYIGVDGPPVHLRRSLKNQKSAVVYGPVDERVMSYEDNINAFCDGCSINCAYATPNWIHQCITMDHKCITNINQEKFKIEIITSLDMTGNKNKSYTPED